LVPLLTAGCGLRLLGWLLPGGQLLTSALVGTEFVLEWCMGMTLLLGEYRRLPHCVSQMGEAAHRPETHGKCIAGQGGGAHGRRGRSRGRWVVTCGAGRVTGSRRGDPLHCPVMVLPDTARRSSDGTLFIGGCDISAVAGRFGTPLYVFDEVTMRDRLRAYQEGISAWPAGGDVLYSAKAYLSPAMVRLLVEEDCGIDVVSGGEMVIALRSGMDPQRIAFPGNNKSPEEVDAAVRAGIGHLVVDSERELDLLAARPEEPRVRSLLRVSPGVQPDTHDFISTGQLDSKFGFGVENGQAMTALRRALEVAALELRGVHMHIGSQIFNLRSYPAAIEVVAAFLDEARRECGFIAEALSVGGGLGIAYTDDDDPPTIGEFMKVVTESMTQSFRARGLPLPALLVEPGRSVAGPAGVAVYTVGARKEIPGVRTYVAVDGGMGDNIRPKLYGARYQPFLVRERGERQEEQVTLAGRYCESTDILVRDCRLPRLRPGDLVGLGAAGAYTLSMSSNYNVNMRPAVVFVRDGVARLVRRRETIDDLLRCEVGGG
jgi:diaminopimelate decarboxylase